METQTINIIKPFYKKWWVIAIAALLIIGIIANNGNKGTSQLNDIGYYNNDKVDTVFVNADEAMNGLFNIYNKNSRNAMEGKIIEIPCTFTREFFETPMNEEYIKLLKSGEREYEINTLDYTAYLNDNLRLVNDGNLLFKCKVRFNKLVLDSIINKNKNYYRAYSDDGRTITIRGKVDKLRWETFSGDGLKLNKISYKMYLVDIINGYIVK